MNLFRTNMLRRLWASQNGGIAVTFALSATGLVMVGGLALDYGNMVRKKIALQGRADSGAVAGAREMSLANATNKQIVSTATLAANNASKSENGASYSVRVKPDIKNTSITVSVTERWTPFFTHYFSDAITPITSSATATTLGQKICVIGLDPKSGQTVDMRATANLKAEGCGVISNSTSTQSIRLDDSATMTAGLICSAGGVFGKGTSFTPAPVLDCPAVTDPLIDRAAPKFSGCDEKDLVVKNRIQTLFPGVYCKGLTISGNASVTFLPGVYIMKDGRFRVTDRASISGENVGFFLTGNKAVIEFAKSTTINLTAPADGPLAGLLFFEDRNVGGNTHRITSDNARLLLGTIYLPNSTLLVDTDAPVADQSAYTAIVVKRLQLNAGPVLTLNSNYSATDIPVPAGLADAKGFGGQIVFSK